MVTVLIDVADTLTAPLEVIVVECSSALVDAFVVIRPPTAVPDPWNAPMPVLLSCPVTVFEPEEATETAVDELTLPSSSASRIASMPAVDS